MPLWILWPQRTKQKTPAIYSCSLSKKQSNLSKHTKLKMAITTGGDYKGTYAGHLLQGLPAFSRFDIPIGGGRNIVKRHL